MKKLLGLTLSLASIVFVASGGAKAAGAPSGATASAASSAAAPQWRDRDRWGRYNRRGHVTTQTRYVRQGRRVYRETYRIRHLPGGGTRVRLISRVRVR